MTAAPGPEMVLVRYGELALKKKNRGTFEHALIRNMHTALDGVTELRVERVRGRMTVLPEGRVGEVSRRLQDLPGIKSVSPAWGCESDPDAIAALGRKVLEEALQRLPRDREITFRVATSRGDKAFPLNSVELDRYIAPRVLEGLEGLKVQLKDPELCLGIEVRKERSYVFVDRLPGPGGLPVGTLGRVMCLLSGGIDSPVAAWLAMKRGCRVSYISFHSYPYIGDASKKKVLDLARALYRFQGSGRLYIAPFTKIQETIRDTAPEAYRTVLYRRMMQRIASRLARLERCQALVTGESVGQVASQTLENMTCIEEAADLPVLRPLVCYDKEETIDLARKLGTFEISKLQIPDCCTVFMPKRPVIRGNLAACLEAEAGMDVEGLVAEAVRTAEFHSVSEWD